MTLSTRVQALVDALNKMRSEAMDIFEDEISELSKTALSDTSLIADIKQMEEAMQVIAKEAKKPEASDYPIQALLNILATVKQLNKALGE